MKKIILLALWFLGTFYAQAQCPSGLSGTYKIGPTGQFTTLKAALDTLRSKGVSGAVVLELQAAYTATNEVFPLSFKDIGCTGPGKTVTLRPEAGATNLVLSSYNTTSTLDLDNARYVTIDGRPGGTGTAQELTLANTAYAASTVRFLNDASWNTLTHVKITGESTTGCVYFMGSNQNVTNGNSYNTIQSCSIYNNTPYMYNRNGIYSRPFTGQKNAGNAVENCLIYNFARSGVLLEAGNTEWRIAGNSFYHSGGFEEVVTIAVNDTTSHGFSIEDNFIGGSAPQCGGARIEHSRSFIGLLLKVGNGSFTTIRNNTIRNVNIQGTSSGGYFAGIELPTGKFSVEGNTIGSTTTTGSIVLKATSGHFLVYGITGGISPYEGAGLDTCLIQNNSIGGIRCEQPDPYLSDGALKAISIRDQQRGQVVIENNVIGSPSVYNSILNDSWQAENHVTGIEVDVLSTAPASFVPQNRIRGNLVANLNGKPRAIVINRSRAEVVDNTVRNIYALKEGEWGNYVWGITVEGCRPGSYIGRNTVHSLVADGWATEIKGISVGTTPGAVVARNTVHSFQFDSVNTSRPITGIIVSGAGTRVQNNVIRLGIDTLGRPVAGNQKFTGLQVALDSTLVTNNSVYIGGSGPEQCVALALTATANRGRVVNNILVNTRLLSGQTAYNPHNHYALHYTGDTAHLPQLDYNIYFTQGARNYLGFFQLNSYTTNFSTILDWRKATGRDSNSLFYDPNFVNATGTAATVDLHLASPNPAEGQGIAVEGVDDDLDGELRAGLSPADIGADAGQFSYQDGDAPVLTHAAFLGQPVPSSFVYTVKITDNGSGVDTTAGRQPRMWLRKKHPVTTTWTSEPGTHTDGTVRNGTWSFSPGAALAGMNLAPGDSLEYYFVAQDGGPIANLGYSNLGGTAHASVQAQTTAPTAPLRLLVYGLFRDTVFVGAGQRFTSLTNDGGFFEAAKTYLFDSTNTHSTVCITSDLLESGKHGFQNLNTSGPVIHFITNSPVVKNIWSNGGISYPLVTMGSLKDVTIDGRVNGEGRYLRFVNRHASGDFCNEVIALYGKVQNLTLRNTILESNATNLANPMLYVGGSDMSRVLIRDNLIKNIDSAAQLPLTGIQLHSKKTDSIVIRGNEVVNFSGTGIWANNTFEASGRVIIDSNHIYYTLPNATPSSRTGIKAEASLLTFAVTNNFIGGSERFCGGTPWSFVTQASSVRFTGIYVSASLQGPTLVSNNTVSNFRFSNFGYGFTGIQTGSGRLLVGTEKGNTIGSTHSDTSIRNVYGSVTGITAAASDRNTPLVVDNNTVSGMEGSNVLGLSVEGQQAVVRNNTISSLKATGSSGEIYGHAGVRVFLESGLVEGNRVTALSSVTTTEFARVCGMEILSGTKPGLVVARNKISDLYGSSPTGAVVGIYGRDGNYIVHNNQVSITNSDSTHPMDIRGIDLYSANMYTPPQLYYNTVRIGGTSASSGTQKSYGVLVRGNMPVGLFRNNLIYNGRTGGTGAHLAFAETLTSSPYSAWPAGTANNNLYVTMDTSKVNEWRTTGPVSMHQWRTLAAVDAASYAALGSDLPAEALFMNPSNHDLDINPANSAGWYVNGKGLPIAGISADYADAGAVRSTQLSTGATDIGSDEFTPTAPPVPLVVSGTHAAGGTEYFWQNGRVVASITWGPEGTLPALGEAVFYSGVWPNDTTNNNTIHFSRSLNAYWHIPASGGNGYSYSLTLHYDSSGLGKVSDVATLVLNKRQPGVAGSWEELHPTVMDTVLKTITVHNQASFSEFTATDSVATLATGIVLPDLLIEAPVLSAASAGTGSPVTISFTEKNGDKGTAGAHKVHFYLSADDQLTPGANGDLLVGQLDLAAALAAGSSRVLDKELTVPCVTPGSYILFAVTDGETAVWETNEANNAAATPLTITQGLSQPQQPLITATPGAAVCSGSTVTLVASADNCSSCTYTWSNGAVGETISVNTSGSYTVTVSNACGAVTATQAVTVDPLPEVRASANITLVCAGSPVQLSASGAGTYSWSPAGGLSATTGATVTATPAETTTYTVTGTSAEGCRQTASVTVEVIPRVTPTVSITQTSCSGGMVRFDATATNGGTSPMYQWYVNNTLSGAGSYFELYNAVNGMQVYCKLTSSANCASTTKVDSEPLTVNCITTALPVIEALESYSIAPNPTHGPVGITLELKQAKDVRFTLTNSEGRVVHQSAARLSGTSTRYIDLSGMATGIYYLKVEIGDKQFTERILKIK